MKNTITRSNKPVETFAYICHVYTVYLFQLFVLGRNDNVTPDNFDMLRNKLLPLTVIMEESNGNEKYATDDKLVLAGWNPGEGRTLPPVSHAAFKKAWVTWITKGAYAPRAK